MNVQINVCESGQVAHKPYTIIDIEDERKAGLTIYDIRQLLQQFFIRSSLYCWDLLTNGPHNTVSSLASTTKE